MKKVLYLSNIEVPYRVRFFNALAKYCDLTVLYERKVSSNRDDTWAKSEKQLCKNKYLEGIPIGRESSFSFRILKDIFSDYDEIIVGCYNTPVQLMAIFAMWFCRKPYTINIDGEPFLKAPTFKNWVKRFVLRGASKYVIAGEKGAKSLKVVSGKSPVTVYNFSSLSKKEIENHSQIACQNRNETVLVVGQYFDYKGMDVALEAARQDPMHHYKFVGMGKRTELFLQEFEGKIPDNVEIVPFMQKPELEKEYQKCAMLVLPSRQECWGLVINEAASFGMPIVSTWGSGAAVDFLADDYPRFLAKPGDPDDLLRCINLCRTFEDLDGYSKFLLEQSKDYTIEENVRKHLQLLGINSDVEEIKA